jgi:hypothetical protein
MNYNKHGGENDIITYCEVNEIFGLGPIAAHLHKGKLLGF